jgi:hypothetical protein
VSDVGQTDVRVFAPIDSMPDLHAAVRARVEELELSRATIDAAAGIPDGYAAKLLAQLPVKRFGATSMWPVLRVVGLKLALVDDPEALASVTFKLPKRDRAQVRSRCQADAGLGTKPSLTAILSSAGSRGGKARMRKLSPAARRRLARSAAAARWERRAAP